jgi:hypothetical protein
MLHKRFPKHPFFGILGFAGLVSGIFCIPADLYYKRKYILQFHESLLWKYRRIAEEEEDIKFYQYLHSHPKQASSSTPKILQNKSQSKTKEKES